MTGDRSLPMYRLVMALATPIVRWWGRLEVVGLDCVPLSGPTVLMGNHDSYWDPVVAGVATAPRRQIRALAKASLWRSRPLAWVLSAMGQIPIERGRGDTEALGAAIEQLRAGACVGVFPEGTISRGATLRAHSGAGRLAVAVPETRVVCGVLTGSVDIARFPKRPRLRVEYFELPLNGEETPLALTRRALAAIRALAPPVAAGRRASVRA
ncbi:MAG TPA: lysophospholipid acyltransferase family protein [Jatrophihabitantaceae bacterium]